MTYKVTKTENGWEIWDGIAFENPPLAFTTKSAATAECLKLNARTQHLFDHATLRGDFDNE